jgi:GNAT superfamily N-acetyltransferase
VPSGATVALVDDEAGIRMVHEVGARGFGSPQVTEEAMQRYVEEFRAARASGHRTEFNFLALVDGKPAGTGGVSLIGDVVRLWGASVLPEFRGRGAYRALVAARLRHARASGARFALTKARTGTSGPILRRLGFHSHGVERCLSISAA